MFTVELHDKTRRAVMGDGLSRREAQHLGYVRIHHHQHQQLFIPVSIHAPARGATI